MIDKRIYQSASDFASHWADKTKNAQAFDLDLSWPSISSLDWILDVHRGLPEQTHQSRLSIEGAASYLSLMVHKCWSNFPDDLSVSAKRIGSVQPEIIVSASGGRFLGTGDVFSVSITKALDQIIFNPPNPFPVFPNFSRTVPPDFNVFSLFGLGLMTGLSPFGEGKWADLDVQEFAPYLHAAKAFLAESSAAYYKKNYPNEPLGQDPDLYLNDLILPPELFDEQFPLTRASLAFLKYFQKKSTPQDAICKVATNLACSPDNLISGAGFVVAAALFQDETLSKELAYVVESKRSFVHNFRTAIVLSRLQLGESGDWYDLLQSGEIEKAKSFYQRDQTLKLIPLALLSAKWLAKEDLQPVFKALSWSSATSALNAIESLPDDIKSHPEITLQAIRLDLSLSNFERAESAIDHLLKSNAHSQELLTFRGQLFCFKGELEAGTKSFQEALKTNALTKNFSIEASTECGSALFSLNKLEDALHIAEQVLKTFPYSSLAQQIVLSSLEILENKNRLEQEILKLPTEAALDKTLFHFISSKATQ